MRRQWLSGTHANRMIEEGKEQYRRFLDYQEHKRSRAKEAMRPSVREYVIHTGEVPPGVRYDRL